MKKGDTIRKVRGTGLTRKQKRFADELLKDPNRTATDVALEVYETDSPKVASVIASENLAKPSLLLYMDGKQQEAEETIVEIMQSSTALKSSSKHAAVALKAANDILDRTIGKPMQRQETTSRIVQVNIDLSKGADTE